LVKCRPHAKMRKIYQTTSLSAAIIRCVAFHRLTGKREKTRCHSKRDSKFINRRVAQQEAVSRGLKGHRKEKVESGVGKTTKFSHSRRRFWTH
jgi:phosphoribulokinase